MDTLLRHDGETVLEGLLELPGGPELRELAAGRNDVELVGGATRDLLLGRTPRELDVLVAGDVAPLAEELARQFGVSAAGTSGDGFGTVLHERFGTASVSWSGGRIDIAARRAESYSAPGALPTVRPGSPEEDLRRRDFTVNAIAVALAGPEPGSLRAAPNALEDLRDGRLRVLHEDSFRDDPTRLLRLARYQARLGFEPEQGTAGLASGAISDGVLASVSGARIGAELRLTLAEGDPLVAVLDLNRLGVIEALSPLLRVDEPLLFDALAWAPADARSDILLVAGLLVGSAESGGDQAREAIRGLLDSFEYGAADRDRVLEAIGAPALLEALQRAERPSELRGALGDAAPEMIVLAGALAEQRRLERASAGARRWLDGLRDIGIQISGGDLLAAGVPAGPEIGRLLARVLDLRLDGELGDGSDEQLRAALAPERPA